MREKKSFAERAKILASDEVRKRYFFVFEGKETERLYFSAVDDLREYIGINPMIEFIPVLRSYSEEGWSNPQKIVKRMIQNIQESREGEITYETLLNWIMDYLQDKQYIVNNRPFAKSVWEILKWICHEKLEVSLSETVENLQESSQQIAVLLERETMLGILVEDITRFICYGGLTYAEGLDKVCFVVDRDKDSFTDSQYEFVLEQCQKRGFGFYVTNPCFEFWLLMHFDDVMELDKEKLMENPKVTSKCRYSEFELRNRVPGYKKSKYNAKNLVRNINCAIFNEKKFCEDIKHLKDAIGSNIGLLICEMREQGCILGE